MKILLKLLAVGIAASSTTLVLLAVGVLPNKTLYTTQINPGHPFHLAKTAVKTSSPDQQGDVLGIATSRTVQQKKTADQLITLPQLNQRLDEYTKFLVSFGPATNAPSANLAPAAPSQANTLSGTTGQVNNTNGQTTVVVGGNPIVSYVPAVPANGFSGTSIAGFGTLSASNFTAGGASVTGNLTVQGSGTFTTGSFSGALSAGTSTLSSLTVSGPVSLTGSTTIAGLTVTGLNPGLNAGSVVFQGASALAQDNSNLFYDSTNHRLGIGTTSPSSTLFVQGSGAVNPFNVVSSTGASLLTVLANGNVGLNTTTAQALLSLMGPAGSMVPLFDVASSTGTSLFRIASNGNVTIGTTVIDPVTGIKGRAGSAGVSGKLLNFFGPTGVASKKVIYWGNSTVWNAVGWYTEMHKQVFSGAVLDGMSVRSDLTNISSTAGGVVTITLGAAVGTDAVVGQWITINPVTGATACLGSGIVTSVSGNTITVPMANSGACVSIASTPSTGTVSKQILNFGNNGATLTSMLADNSTTGTGIGGVCAALPDLLIIRGPLINDVRTGGTTLSQAITRIGTMIDRIRACSPTTDILLKTENSLLTTDVGAAGYVVPNSSAQAYSDILRQAVMYYSGVYPGVIVVDTQASYWGTASQATSAFMGDQLHPNAGGQVVEAQQDIKILAKLKNTGYQLVGDVDPSSSIPTPFSPYLAAHARANNYAAPWTFYPHACADTNYYTLIASGMAGGGSAGQTYLDFTSTAGGAINASDIVEQQTAGCWALPTTASSGQNGPTTRILMNGGAPTPYAVANGELINVWRSKFGNSAAEVYVRDTTNYPYRRRIIVGQAGNGFFDFNFRASEHMNAYGSAVSTADVIVLDTSGVVPLAGATLGGYNTGIRSFISGDRSAYQGQPGWIFGNHPFEGQPDTNSNVIFAGNVAVGYRSGITTNPLTISSSTGTTLLTVLQTGNVGIGTATPTSTLSVQGTTGTNPLVIASSTGTQLVTVTQAGNVGIGTSTPTLGPLVMASGAYVTTGGTWTNASDRNLKENFATITPASILEKIIQLSVTQWNYKGESASTTHIGPVAQDFYEAFHLGGSNTSISTIDPAGVALLGIQALDQKIAALQGSLTGNASTSNLSVYIPSNFSGDSVGEAKILAGQTSIRVSFRQAYSQQPIVTFSPEGAVVPAFIQEKDSAGFTLAMPSARTTDVTFDWHSFASPQARLTVSDGTTQPIQLIITSTPAATSPAPAAAKHIGPSSPLPEASMSNTAPTVLGTSTPVTSSAPATSTPAQTPSSNSTTTSSSSAEDDAASLPVVSAPATPPPPLIVVTTPAPASPARTAPATPTPADSSPSAPPAATTATPAPSAQN
jgi:hypothetical protein